MPSSRHATITRSAISPRLAIRIFLNILRGLDGKESLTVLDRLSVFHVAFHDFAVTLGVDLVHQLHRLDDAKHLPFANGVSHFGKRLGARVRRSIKRADDRRLHDGEVERLVCRYEDRDAVGYRA